MSVVQPYSNNIGLISRGFEDTASKSTENSCCQQPHCYLMIRPGNPHKYLNKLYTNTPPTYNTLCKRLFLERCQTKVANLHRTWRASNKYIVTLEITVNDGRQTAVQKQKALENLPAPILQYVDVNFLEPSNVTTQQSLTQRDIL